MLHIFSIEVDWIAASLCYSAEQKTFTGTIRRIKTKKLRRETEERDKNAIEKEILNTLFIFFKKKNCKPKIWEITRGKRIEKNLGPEKRSYTFTKKYDLPALFLYWNLFINFFFCKTKLIHISNENWKFSLKEAIPSNFSSWGNFLIWISIG